MMITWEFFVKLRAKANSEWEERWRMSGLTRANSINIITQLLFLKQHYPANQRIMRFSFFAHFFMLRIWGFLARARLNQLEASFLCDFMKRLFCLFMEESRKFMMPNFRNYLLLIVNSAIFLFAQNWLIDSVCLI